MNAQELFKTLSDRKDLPWVTTSTFLETFTLSTARGTTLEFRVGLFYVYGDEKSQAHFIGQDLEAAIIAARQVESERCTYIDGLVPLIDSGDADNEFSVLICEGCFSQSVRLKYLKQVGTPPRTDLFFACTECSLETVVHFLTHNEKYTHVWATCPT